MRKPASILLLLLGICPALTGQYRPTPHRVPQAGEIPVYKAGGYGQAGARYILMNDIVADRSALFLGGNVELDLNGYTIYYAKGKYRHMPNSGFEDGSNGWDLRVAPGAQVRNTADVHVFLGKKLLSLQAGDIVRSPWVQLPVQDRSYFAMVGITGRHYHDSIMAGNLANEMRISVYVEDEKGNDVVCNINYGDSLWQACPVENRSPRLGGGFVYAHLRGLPAGRYRVRIKADTDCLIDEVDIRPAMDVGIGIVDKTQPLAHYDHQTKERYAINIPAFFDYTADYEKRLPVTGIPRAGGEGVVRIKNGRIEAGFEGIHSWAIQSTAKGVKLELDNVEIKAGGISAGAAELQWADIRNCRFEVKMPFLVQRHVSICAVAVRGPQPSEVTRNDFIGGQGCLTIRGKRSLVHDNLFVNEQTVTNHYSIMGTGDSSRIFNNRFEPRQGSGIYVSRYTEVFDNYFSMQTSPPTCEYGREEYSVAAIRLGDYNAAPGSPKASLGSRIYRNRIDLLAKDFPEPKEYIPMLYGIYYSASGGENEVFDNEIHVRKENPGSKTETAALYVCGGPRYFGGLFYRNRFFSNVPAVWIASRYGGAAHSQLINNLFVMRNTTGAVSPVRMGWEGCTTCYANDVSFRSNQTEGALFNIEKTKQDHSYQVYWSCSIQLSDKSGTPVAREIVQLFDDSGRILEEKRTDSAGWVQWELLSEEQKKGESLRRLSYQVKAGGHVRRLDLIRNEIIKIMMAE